MNDNYNKSDLNGFDEVTKNQSDSDKVEQPFAQTIKETNEIQQSRPGSQTPSILHSDTVQQAKEPITQNNYGYNQNTQEKVQSVADPGMQSNTGYSSYYTNGYGYSYQGQAVTPPSQADQTARTDNCTQPTQGIQINSLQAAQPGQMESAPYPSTGYYSGYSGYASTKSAQQQRKKKTKKDKKKYGLGAVLTCGICTMVVGVLLSVGIMVYGVLPNITAASSETNNGAVTNINVDTTANSTTEAIAEKVSPSVVGIRTTVSANYQFFGEQESSGEGTGIIYTSDGYIITNYHVISSVLESRNQTSAKIEVFLPDDTDTPISATVVGYDITSDLAVLKIEATNLQAIEVGDSDALKVGEPAVAVGNPGGLDFMGSVSAGIISGLNRTIQLENSAEMNLIQTDAAINPGNSGGPLVNVQGQLIGVNSSKMAAEGYEGMGFAIPSNSVVEICDGIIENKDEKKPYVGIEISTQYDAETLTAMGYPAGVVVQSVVQGGPAEEAGLQGGDIITQFNGTAVSSYTEFNDLKNKCKVGETVKLTVFRLGQSIDISLTLGESSL